MLGLGFGFGFGFGMAFCTSSLLPLACAAATRGVRMVGMVEVTMEHVEYTWFAADCPATVQGTAQTRE